MRILRRAAPWNGTPIRWVERQHPSTLHSHSHSHSHPHPHSHSQLHSIPLCSLSQPHGAAQHEGLTHKAWVLRNGTMGLSKSTGPAAITAITRHAETYHRRTLFNRADQKDSFVQTSGRDGDSVTPQEHSLRVGKAIRTLRQELPQFFEHGLCNTSIYASNIQLIEASHTNVSLQGKTVYFLLAGAVRWSFKMWFRDLEFEIQSIRLNDRGGRGGGLGDIQDVDAGTINKISPVTGSRNVSQMNTDHYLALCRSTSRINPVFDPSSRMGRNVDAAIEYNGQQVMNSQDTYQGQGQEQVLGDLPPSASVTVRWTLKGTTRPSVVLTLSGPTSPPPSTFSGVFVYEFDDRGLVNEHRIENIMPSPSREAIDRAFAWWGWLLSRTRPTAAAASEVDASRKRLGLGCFQTK